MNLELSLKRFLNKPRNILMLYVFVMVFFVGVLVVGFILITKGTPVNQDNGLTKKEEQEILGQIIENNAQNLFNKPDNSPSNNPKPINQPQPVQDPVSPTPTPVQPEPVVPTPGEIPLPDPEIVPDITKYNFRKTVTTVAYGPSSDKCQVNYGGDGGGYFFGNLVSKTESVEFFTSSSAKYKYVYSDADNDLVNYQLTEYGKDVHQAYVYMNGSFAVLAKYKPFDNYNNDGGDTRTISYPQGTPEELLAKFFGVNAKVLGKIIENGKEYYVIQNFYDSYCSSNPYLVIPGVEPAKQEKILEIYKVDAKSFSIVEINKYINSLNSTNLISRTKIDTEIKLLKESELGDTFVFNKTGNIREIDYTNYKYNIDKSYQDMIDFLGSKDINILFPNKQSRLSNIFSDELSKRSVPSNGNYYAQRDFYQVGPKGDSLFNRYNNTNNYSQSELSLYFAENSLSYNEYIYDQSIGIDKLISDLTSYPATATTDTNAEVVINGEVLTARKIVRRFDYIYPYAVSYPSYPVSYVNSYSYTSANYLFIFEGRLYNIAYSVSTGSVLPDTLEFNSFNSSNETDMQYIAEQVKTAFYYYLYPSSYPSSYTIYPVSY